MEKREWEHIRIRYDDGTEEVINRADLERIMTLEPILEGLNMAYALKKRLENILK